jgi:hypothetical protein
MRSTPRVLVALCLAVAATACGRTLDAEGLEEQLRGELHQRLPGTEWEVSCPDGISPEAGTKFTCEATDENGRTVELEITQDDAEGRVTWRIVGLGG